MKKVSTILVLFCLSISVFAQKKAVTETGEEVILYDDYTWKYQNEKEAEVTEITTSKKKYTKHDNSTFLLKSNKTNLGFWIDPKSWSFKKAAEDGDAEYELQFKKGDLYAMIISEKIEIPLETLKDIALENGRAAAPDLKIAKQEYRIVNGQKLLHLQMNGTLQGIKFSYYGYYFSNTSGTVQFISYTSTNLLNEYKKDCEKLLNGIVELKD